jgi:hypothetical protein
MIYCKSCNFPINEGETVKECEQCGGTTHSFCLLNNDGVRVCDVCMMTSAEKPKRADFVLPDHIRRTYIETYRKCPNKFKLEVLDGHKSPPNKYTQVGIDLHELFEKAVLDRSYTQGAMMHDYQGYYHKQLEMGIFESEEDKQKFTDRAFTSIKEFYNVLPSIPTPFATEQTIHYSIGDDVPLVEFTMDLITENENGNLDLHDWKTGKVMVGQTISSDLQAPLYIYGVQQHFNRIVDSFTFYYLNEGKTRTFNRINNLVYECKVGKRSYYINLEDTIKQIKSIFNQIKKGNFNIPQDTRKMFFTCKMCHLKEQGLCSGADQESWYQLNGGRNQ